MKKKLLVLLISFPLSLFLYSQQWTKSLEGSANPTFFEIQKAFNDYYENKFDSIQIIEGEDGDYSRFKRWERYWESRVDGKGSFPSPLIIWDEWKKYQENISQKKLSPSIQMTGNWVALGPSAPPIAASYSGVNESGMGRVNCIAFHPTNPNIFWIGSPAGGLWKTTNGGSSWAPLTDNLPVIGVSDIAIDYTNPNIIYIASGDAEHPPYQYDGWKASTNSIGILKTTDGGITWNTTGLTFNVSSFKYISKIIIHPTNPNILLAAASDGIYRTTNGGATWTNNYSGKYFTDIAFKPNNPNRVYAAEYNSAGNAGIYISTNGGITWPLVNNPSGNAMRIKLDVTPLNSNYVDALIASVNGGTWLQGYYFSPDSGMTFNFTYGTWPSENNLLANDCTGSWCTFQYCSQGWYDLIYMYDPVDVNTSWGGGVNIWKSTDGGNTWNINTTWNGSICSAIPVHGDHHLLTYNPLNNYIYDCNDGGLFRTTNGGASWTNLSNGLQISQMFRLGQNAADGNDIICGLQDNGTYELFGGTWYQDAGGDGMECMIDPTNGNIEYMSYYSGNIYKTTNGFSSAPTAISPISPGNWVTPYVMHPTNSNILYAAYADVWQSGNGGSTWNNISSTYSPLTGNTATYLKSLAVAPSNPNYIYTAKYSQIYMTNNGGATWITVTNNLPLTNSSISYIAIKQNDPLTVWVTLSGYASGDKVYKTINGGSSWINISGSLPNIPFNCIVYENGSNDGLYIGGDIGVYYRDNSMSDWSLFNTGLPNAPVYELEIHYGIQKLRSATFGRGLWESDLIGAFTGTSNIFSENFYSVYPNPNKGPLTIHSSNNDLFSIKIFNPLGEIIYTFENIMLKKEIDLSASPNGIYFLQISTKTGTIVKKLLVSK